ncbi:hypothetical protein V8E51_018307 [Hyaloscypha variabilis]
MYTSFGAHFVREMAPNRRRIAENLLPLYTPPCTCLECESQFTPMFKQQNEHNHHAYAGSLSFRDAERSVQEYSRSAGIDRSFLRDKFREQSKAIIDTWSNFSVLERKKVLLGADNTMYEFQWGEARHTVAFQWGDIGTAMRDFRIFNLLSYVNLEALSQDPARFLNLLMNRINYSPQDWAPYDSHLLRLPWNTGAFERYFNQNCVVMQGPNYGSSLVPWSQLAHTWEIIGFPRAQLILEAQKELMKILRGVVEIILRSAINNTPSAELGLFGLSAMKFNHTSTCNFTSGYLNQPFSEPPLFDITKLLSIAQTRRDTAGDHVWLLQTDSQYARHWISMIGNIEYCEIEKSKNKYAFIAREFYHDVHTFWSWKWLVEEVENVERVYKDFNKNVPRGEALPKDLGHALGALEVLLTSMLDRLSRHIQATIAARPGFTEGWEIEYNALPGKALAIRTDGIREPDRFYKDPLDWCLRQLLGPPDGAVKYEHAMLFAFLDNYLETCPQGDKDRLDEVLLTKYSDFAALHEMRVMVRLHRPRNIPLRFEEYKTMEHRRVWKFARKELLEGGLNWLNSLPGRRSAQANALEKFSKTTDPDSASKDTMQGLKQTDDEREALGAFWNVVKEQHREFFATKGLTVTETTELLMDLSANTAPEYLQALKVEREETLAIIEAIKVRVLVDTSYSAMLRKSKQRKQNQSKKSKNKGKSGNKNKSKNNLRPFYKPQSTGEGSDVASDNTSEHEEVDDSIHDLSLEMLTTSIENVTTKASTINQTPTFGPPESEVEILTNYSARLEASCLPAKSYPKEKSKQKASRKRSEVNSNAATLRSAPAESPAPRRVFVKRGVLEIIGAMFPRRRSGELGALAWEEFEHAMDQVGFSARRNGGSAVLFEPKKESAWYGKGKIVFHRPHPCSKIVPIRLRAIGKRMGKWFGWSRDLFVPDEKAK